MVELTDVFRTVESAVAEPTADDWVVLDTSDGRFFTIGEVGGFIWAQLDGEADLDEVAASVAARYRILHEEAAADLLEFVGELLDRGLVVPRPASSSR